MSIISQFLIRISVFTVIIASISELVFHYIFPQFYKAYFPLAIIFFFVVTISFHIIILKASKFRISKFANYFMLSSTAKLLVYIAFLAIYIYLNKGHAIPFAVFVLVLYLFYTIFEVALASQHLKKIKNTSK